MSGLSLVPPAAEVPISRELVRTLLAQQYPGLADREIADPFEGFDMAVFRLGADLAVRLPRHSGSVRSLESEIRWTGRLGARWTFPTQRIVHVGRVPAENVIRAGQAACSYSWRMPPRRSRRWMFRWTSPG